MILCGLNKVEEGISPGWTTGALVNQECNAIPIHMQICQKEAFKPFGHKGEQIES